MTSPTKTFCILPWIHLNTWPNGNVYQCCITNWRNHCGNTKDNTLEEVWNNDYMKGLRKAMLAGEKHESCDRCYMLEESKLGSFRQSSNKNFSKYIPAAVADTHPDGHSPDFKLLYWDFRFSNLCNFKCRMCGSSLSSSWYDDHVKMNEAMGRPVHEPRVIQIDDYTKKPFKEYLLDFIDTVEEVYFAGGEPLLMDEHYFILEELMKRGRQDVRIRYNTNLSKLKYKKWDVLEYWKYFGDNVTIFASIDGTGDIAEYVRSGTDWRVLEKNIKTILEFNPRILGISATTQIFNLFNIPVLIDKLLGMGIHHSKMMVSNVLSYPQYYSIQILPDDIKKLAKDTLEAHLTTLDREASNHFRGQYSGIIDFMNTPVDGSKQHLKTELKRITTQLDGYRGEDYNKVLPDVILNWINCD